MSAASVVSACGAYQETCDKYQLLSVITYTATLQSPNNILWNLFHNYLNNKDHFKIIAHLIVNT